MKKKRASQTAPKSSWKNAILLAITALALSASPGATQAADCIGQTTWIDSIGSWFVPANWNGGQPSTATNAEIDNSGTAQINTSTPTAHACSLTLGYNGADSGKVSVSTGILDISNEALVGAAGKGTLTITNGGTVTTGIATIAAFSGSVGTLSVDGASTSCTINGGAKVAGDASAGGTGLMKVTNSGTVSAVSVYVFSSGTLAGNGTITTTNGTTLDGTIAPSGRLTIGGNLTFASSAAAMQSNVVPASADNVVVSATASLNGRLAVTMTGTFTGNIRRFTLLHAGGVLTGRFSNESINYPPNQGFIPKITYDYVGNNVYLDLVFNQ